MCPTLRHEMLLKEHLEYGKGHSMCCMGRYGTNEINFMMKLTVIIKFC